MLLAALRFFSIFVSLVTPALGEVSINPGLNTVIIPKLPLDSILISFWLSAFINTLPVFALFALLVPVTFTGGVVNQPPSGFQSWGSSGFSCIAALSGAFKLIAPLLIIWVIVVLL